ncbi:hypothetical protein PIB30_088870 [Stylosanthes scabra]|uniref:CASP-like protein n=1 Tax=Stylosanthes scabra TaxID=79078 RepID=A0ABU6RU39_9FABA|nr:hypothetical protein [Stylosanthes scabra]
MSKETSTQEMKDASKAQEEEGKPQHVKKDSQDKVETSKEKKIKNKKKEEKEEPQLPVSESPKSITYHSSGGSFTSSEAPPTGAPFKMAPDEADKVEEGIVDGGRNSGYLMSKKEAKLSMILLGLRIATFVFCLVSFSVLADDSKKGPIRYSFDRHKELKYCLAANAIGCMYSMVQICALVKYLITKTHMGNAKLLRCITFVTDQVVTYLLLSAATSAATIMSMINIKRQEQYEYSVIIPFQFVDMANASVALSFMAFKAFALATLLSGYILCKFNY